MSEQKIDKRSKEYRNMKDTQVISDAVLDTIVPQVPAYDNGEVLVDPKVDYMANQPVPKIKGALPSPVKVRGVVSIKAYVSGEPNMGHEKYDEVLFPGSQQQGTVFCDVHNNVKTYKTGLNEFAAEVQSIADPEERISKIKYIREVVAWLENMANANFKVSPKTCMDFFDHDDDPFWDNVTMFQSVCVDKYDPKGNRLLTYWDRLQIILNNEGRALNLKDPHDIAVYHVALADGLGLVASSLQKAMSEPGFNFYLNKVEDTAVIKTEFKIQRNKAAGILESFREGDANKLFYMAVICSPEGAAHYRIGGESASPVLQMYDDLCNYLDGKTLESSTRIATANFLKYSSYKVDELLVRAIVKCATELNLIVIRQNGQMVYVKTGATLGKSTEDVVANFLNPQHQETYFSVREIVRIKWAE